MGQLWEDHWHLLSCSELQLHYTDEALQFTAIFPLAHAAKIKVANVPSTHWDYSDSQGKL